jgi:hypothetical protein
MSLASPTTSMLLIETWGDAKRAKNYANKTKIWKLDEMDADHVEAWRKGGVTSIGNCQMLCKTHNHAKGNK